MNIIFLLLFNLPTYFSLTLSEGTFTYEAKVKAIGFISETIKGVNKNGKGTIIYEEETWKGKINIPVVDFRSGNKRRDQDVAEILNYKKYPFIEGWINFVEKKDLEEGFFKNQGEIHAKVTLKVNGKEKSYSTVISYETDNGINYNMALTIFAKFTDFELKPPTFGGFIKKAENELILKGNLKMVLTR